MVEVEVESEPNPEKTLTIFFTRIFTQSSVRLGIPWTNIVPTILRIILLSKFYLSRNTVT